MVSSNTHALAYTSACVAAAMCVRGHLWDSVWIIVHIYVYMLVAVCTSHTIEIVCVHMCMFL